MKPKIIPFRGAATALVTPMKDDLSIDYAALGRLIEFQISSGIDALLLLGTTGEPCTLSDKEKEKLICYAAEKTAKRVPLVVGVGSNDTRHASELSQFASKEGADALLVVTPYYNKTSPSGLIRHFYTVADASECPVMLYNIPSRTGMRISTREYEQLAQHENIVGVKEASGDIAAIAELIGAVGDGLAIYSGNDTDTVPIMALGGVGVISVLSNIMPSEVAKMCSLMASGETKEAAKLSLRLMPLTKALFCEVNPIPIKEAFAMMGLFPSYTRPPLCELSDSGRDRLLTEMKKQGLIE